MKILIVEDEELSAERLHKLILTIDPSIHLLGIFPSVLQTIAYLENEASVKPDLIFLDIHLEDGDGFKIIETLNLMTPIIFTTAFDEYMLKAFKTNSIDYLLKPVNPLELQASLSKFKKLSEVSENKRKNIDNDPEVQTYKDRFLCSAGSRFYTFKTTEIAYFVIEQRATFLRLFDGRHFAVEYSLDRLSQIIDPAIFFRINRNMLICFNSIENIHMISAGKIKLDLDPAYSKEIFVSTDRITEFKIWLGK
ncbi:LytTR family DNA-binding domain-containing protein [Dyadobacter sp. CY356]|uniref:LytR/AlgR family response regulator transcription factor n=1 Tax=Dyadobacter sp. CY356 TaxID=2906442 RepID=UPI001F1760A5|nr:LytTR family DNA-binding domain-containing protein [Dyadobacter sp. CY356]MCF0054622.1 LytTR family DNA-binding domain-containing protein [Dyadobacter sp. CY356]